MQNFGNGLFRGTSSQSYRSRKNRIAIESLERRELLADSSFLVVADSTQNFGNTRRALNYYEVTDLPGYAGSTFFNQLPMFSVWPGFENSVSRDREEINAVAVNPVNGTTYLLSFDSGSPGGTDGSTGDGLGDYDLYRFNFAAIRNDFVTNSRPRGIMYAPAVSTDGLDYAAFYGSAYPAVDDTFLGVPEGRSNIDGNPNNDIIFLPGMMAKVGEVARYGASGSTPFFNQQDLQVVDDDTLLLMENKPADVATGLLTHDYSIRSLERVDTAPGAAMLHAGETGGTNHQTTESWESFAWTGDNFVNMDDHSTTGSLSNVDGMRYVSREGVQGVWVSDRDGGGDDFAFFKLDFDARTVQKQELRVGSSPFLLAFALDEDPVASANTNDGDVSFFDVDSNGKLIIVENSFVDTFPDAAEREPRVITRSIFSYNGSDSDSSGRTEVLPGGWTSSAKLVPSLDDDAEPTNSSFGVYVEAQNLVYLFDADSAGAGVVGDVYVVDATTGALLYDELDAANHFFNDANTIRSFTIDTTAPTVDSESFVFFYNTPPQAFRVAFSESVHSSVQLSDVSVQNLTTSAIINPSSYSYNFETNTATFRYDTVLPDGNYRVTLGAGNFTDEAGNGTASASTFDFFVLAADANRDRRVNLIDLMALAVNWQQSEKTFSEGDFNYDGTVDATDLGLLSLRWQQQLDPPPVPSAAVPTSARSVFSRTPIRTATRPVVAIGLI